LLPDLAEDPELADCFIREIKLLASLNHPNRAGLHAAFRLENQLLMVMEFVEGTTLDERSKAGVKVGDHLGVFRQGRQIKDPATGKVLKSIETKLGDVTITEVDDTSSTGTYAGQASKVGDAVRNSP
jgi:serine/threonine protein kinase